MKVNHEILMKPLAIPLKAPKTVAKWLVNERHEKNETALEGVKSGIVRELLVLRGMVG